MCKSSKNKCNDYSLQTANTGVATISVANSGLNGAGTVVTVFTAGQSGAIIRSVTIKATGPVTTGMVRLFILQPSPAVTTLYKEVQIPVTPTLPNTPTPAPVLPVFEATLTGDLVLQAGCSLLASTQTANTFNIIVEGLDWEYPTPLPDVCCNFKQVTGLTGVGIVSAANPNLNGSGNIALVLTAPPAASSNGALLKNMTIKAMGSTSINGMIRLFISDDGGTTYFLMKEIPVPQTVQSAFEPSWKQVVELDYHLQPDYLVAASTQNGEPFSITIEAEEWSYPI